MPIPKLGGNDKYIFENKSKTVGKTRVAVISRLESDGLVEIDGGKRNNHETSYPSAGKERG